MSNFSHCGNSFELKNWKKIFSTGDYAKLYKYQIVYQGICPHCKRQVRGWSGITASGFETVIYGIKPRQFLRWQKRLNYSTDLISSSEGSNVVKAQRYYDGKPLGAMGLQQVR